MSECKKCNGDGYFYEEDRRTPTRCACSRSRDATGSAFDAAIKALEANVEANEQAAKNSPQCQDWSLGVAAGLQIAIGILKQNKEVSDAKSSEY